jgi:hypothetical protein
LKLLMLHAVFISFPFFFVLFSHCHRPFAVFYFLIYLFIEALYFVELFSPQLFGRQPTADSYWLGWWERSLDCCVLCNLRVGR